MESCGGEGHERVWLKWEDAQQHKKWGNSCGELPANPCVSEENDCKTNAFFVVLQNL